MRERIVISADDGQLSFAERAISVVLGLGIAAASAKPRPNPVLNVLGLVAGSYLAWRGATGRDPLNVSVLDDDRA